MGAYNGSTWVHDDGREYLRVYQQISPDVATERLAAGVPLMLEREQSIVRSADWIVNDVCTAQDNARNRRKGRRGSPVSGCWVIELWRAASGDELMMAIEMSGPRDDDLLFDPFGKRHMKDDPIYSGDG